MKYLPNTLLLFGSVLALGAVISAKGPSSSNQAKQPMNIDRPATPVPSLPTLLKGIVYQDLIESHRKADATNVYGLYCLVENSEHAYWTSLFTNLMPRVEVGTNSIDVEKFIIIDRVTKKAAKRFWATVGYVRSDVAEVDAGWYTGRRSSETLRYELRQAEGKWKITKRFSLIRS